MNDRFIGAGKTTLSIALENALFEQKALVTILDEDVDK
jgi:adenylylsulfate kinase-like enzyme